MSLQRINLNINGIVQGVGFRPFIWRLAKRYNLKGFVQNSSKGVDIEVEGDSLDIEAFLKSLKRELPPLARVDSINLVELKPLYEESFKILDSKDGLRVTAISPDIALCKECLFELFDKGNRRYLHPFISCTNCGPRYSIIDSIPYDRVNTSMAKFKMCKECYSEYTNPNSRRYHAQPIACNSCGPKLRLYIKEDSNYIELNIKEPISYIAKALLEGKIVAIKGLGGFHIIANATDDRVLRSLREKKNRPKKPFALMVKDLRSAKEIAYISDIEEALLDSKESPIVLLKKRDSSKISSLVAPNIDRVGLMLPYTPIHHLLFKYIVFPIVATSANLGGEPIITDSLAIREKLSHLIDIILDNDRDILNACDDSIAQVVSGKTQWLRLARGVAPYTLTLDRAINTPTLALGAGQKSSIALAFDKEIVVSPYIGDLETLETFEYFNKTIDNFKRFYEFEPKRIVCDLHPNYLSTSWAKEYIKRDKEAQLYQVQHHYAHALAIMAEYNFKGEALSIIFDGTGYGEDKTIWGAEILLCSKRGFKRLAHLRPFRLLGGERAIKEPRRVALSLLFELFTLDEVLELNNPTLKSFKESEIRALYQSWKKGLNAPLCSSMGRLFDAFASLAGVLQYQSYEGESGLLLEANFNPKDYQAKGLWSINNRVIDYERVLKEALKLNGSDIPSFFLYSLVDLILLIVELYPNYPIILSGGVFQNRTLLELLLPKLKDKELLIQKRIPPNDASIALGQLWSLI